MEYLKNLAIDASKKSFIKKKNILEIYYIVYKE